MATHLECGSSRCPARFAYTPYQVGHTHASWLIQAVDLERVRYRSVTGMGDSTRYVKILDEEDSTAADAITSWATSPRDPSPTVCAALTRDPLHWLDARAATRLRGVAGMVFVAAVTSFP